MEDVDLLSGTCPHFSEDLLGQLQERGPPRYDIINDSKDCKVSAETVSSCDMSKPYDLNWKQKFICNETSKTTQGKPI